MNGRRSGRDLYRRLVPRPALATNSHFGCLLDGIEDAEIKRYYALHEVEVAAAGALSDVALGARHDAARHERERRLARRGVRP